MCVAPEKEQIMSNVLLERLGLDEVEQQAIAEIAEENFKAAVVTRKAQLRRAAARASGRFLWWGDA